MLIEKTGTAKYVMGLITVTVTRANGKKPEYTISDGEDRLFDLSESEVSDLLTVLVKMRENGDITQPQRPKLTPR